MQAAPSGQSACAVQALTQLPPGKSESTAHFDPSAQLPDGPPDVVQLAPTTFPSLPTSELPSHPAIKDTVAIRRSLDMLRASHAASARVFDSGESIGARGRWITTTYRTPQYNSGQRDQAPTGEPVETTIVRGWHAL